MATDFDVVVVGAGNAAFCAALAASEAGARVLMLEKAPPSEMGGNTFFTAGAVRIPYGGLDDLIPLLHQPDEAQLAATDIDPYPPSTYLADMRRVTGDRCDLELTAALVDESAAAVAWLRGRGQQFSLLYDRQSYRVEGRYRFWGNLSVGFHGGGKGMVERYRQLAMEAGIELRCSSAVTHLVRGQDGGVVGVVAGGKRIYAAGVVLAAGGFEANGALRAQHLGPGWDQARVRGTQHNTGEVLMMALEAGAAPAGDWSGCHATPWDTAAPEYGDWELTNRLTKLSYPLGIMINTAGERFVDEGADFRNYTYARYGREILRQPNGVAWQLFDSQTFPLLNRDEYIAGAMSHVAAHSLLVLAERLGIPRLPKSVVRFNSACMSGTFDPTIRDGKRTKGVTPPKSNWALPLERPPFHAFAVTCGITFTFGGLRIDTAGRVLDRQNEHLRGLYAAGELAGGLFFGNYPGGGGLAAGAVFGRRAGASAAAAGL